jgi:hypothetical protein
MDQRVDHDPREFLVRRVLRVRQWNNPERFLFFFHDSSVFQIVGPRQFGMVTKPVTGGARLVEHVGAFIRTWDFSKVELQRVWLEGNIAAVKSGGILRHVESNHAAEVSLFETVEVSTGMVRRFVSRMDGPTIERLLLQIKPLKARNRWGADLAAPRP